LEPLIANARGARFGDTAGIALAVALIAVAASCRHEEQRAAGVPNDRAGLAFTRYATPDRPSVWVADADGSHARRVVTGAYSPKLSPDGRRLAYMVPGDEPDSLPTLFVRDTAGATRPRRVGIAFAYEWSPDGTRLAAQGPQSLVLFDVRSGKRRTLVRGRLVGGLSFAPGGNAIAYSRWNSGAGRYYRSDIFVIGLATGRVTRLTRNRHSDQPVWGRRWIVYRRFHFSGDWSIGRLRLMRSDGTGDRLLARGDERTSLARMGLQPLELSANGKVLLACAAAEFHCPPVMLLVPRGVGASFEATIRRLARRGELASAGDVSRDGRAVLFTISPFDSPVGGRVYAARFDSGEPRLLLRNAREASWAP
jgi:Tol biopolymer transport system component